LQTGNFNKIFVPFVPFVPVDLNVAVSLIKCPKGSFISVEYFFAGRPLAPQYRRGEEPGFSTKHATGYRVF